MIWLPRLDDVIPCENAMLFRLRDVVEHPPSDHFEAKRFVGTFED